MLARCICPFHDDTEPSLVIYEDLHVHCFGCQYHGSLLVFMIDLFGLSEGYKMYRRGDFSFLMKHSANGKYGDREEFSPGEEIGWDPRHRALRGVHLSEEWLRGRVGARLFSKALEIPFRYLDLSTGQEKKSAQYRLSPGKYLFSRGYKLRSSIAYVGRNHSFDRVVLVEGLLDAWKLLSLGCSVPMLVLQGSYISDSRKDFLRDKEVLCMLDRDAAGERITREIMGFCSRARVIDYEAGDPQELVNLPEGLAS